MGVSLCQPRRQRDQRHLFHQRIPLLLEPAQAGDGPVRGAQHLDQVLLLEAAQPPGEQGAGGPALRGDGKAVEFHEKLVDKFPFPFVGGAVQLFELAQPAPQGLEFGVQIRGKGAVDPQEAEIPRLIPGHHVGPVHVEEKFQQFRIVRQVGDIPGAELLPEDGPEIPVQVGGNPVQIFPDGPPLAFFRGMEEIELEDFLLVGEGAVEGHHAEVRQMLVFREILFKRRQQLPGLDEGIGGVIRGQQPQADVGVFQEVFEQVAVPDGGRISPVRRQREAVQFYLAKEFPGTRHLTCHNFDVHLAGSGPVEFRQIDPLPGAQEQPAVAHQHGELRPHEAGLDVGRGVAFQVAIGLLIADDPVQDHEDVGRPRSGRRFR